MTGEEWEFVRFTAWIATLSTLLMLPFGLADWRAPLSRGRCLPPRRRAAS